MKKIMLLLMAVVLCLSAFSQQQQQKKDSLILSIRIDTTTFKYVTALIKENIDTRTTSGQLIVSNILTPLYNFELVPAQPVQPAVKPKETTNTPTKKQ